MQSHIDREATMSNKENVMSTCSTRKETRRVSHESIVVHGRDRLSYMAMSINYSKCGLGIITNLDISQGDLLTVSCSDFWPEPKSGTVVWVKATSYGIRKAGLSLCDQTDIYQKQEVDQR